MGIEHIGSLFEIPRHELSCRFGPDLLRRLDQATGEVVEPITPVRTTAPIEAARLFEGAVTSLEAILVTARELLLIGNPCMGLWATQAGRASDAHPRALTIVGVGR